MRVAQISGPDEIEIREVLSPTPEPDGVVVDITSCGVCATDAHAFAAGGGTLSRAIFGHEWGGVVTAVGRDVVGITEGQIVGVAVGSPCGDCGMCEKGIGEMCLLVQREARGRDASAPGWGGFAERIPVSARRVLPIPDGVGEDERALLEPAAVAYRGVRKLGIRLDDVVVVQGAGAIGLFAMQWAKLAGAGRVVVVEPSQSRAELATSLGADVVLHPEGSADLVRELTGGLGADVSIECSGVARLVHTAFGFTRRGGTLGLLGYPLEPSSIPVDQWLVGEVAVRTSLGYDRADMTATVRYAGAGGYSAAGMPGRRTGFDDLATTLDEIHDGRSADLRAIFDPRAENGNA